MFKSKKITNMQLNVYNHKLKHCFCGKIFMYVQDIKDQSYCSFRYNTGQYKTVTLSIGATICAKQFRNHYQTHVKLNRINPEKYIIK